MGQLAYFWANLTPFSLQYSFSEPTEVTGYVIKSRNVNEAPRDFELQVRRSRDPPA
jgi:hypothetical protein